MIVNYTEEGWEIITQRAHGLLAAQIASCWKIEERMPRWLETLAAIACHDDQNLEFEDREQLQAAGGPMSFKMNPFDKNYSDHLLNMGMARSRYIGLLMARHLIFLYGDDPKAKAYCKQLKSREALWLKEASLTVEELDCGYQLLEFCDAFSLIICRNLVQPEQRGMEISKGPDGTPYELRRNKEGSLIVSPWPFSNNEFELNYELRVLKDLSFSDDSAFHKALLAAPVVLRTVVCSRG